MNYSRNFWFRVWITSAYVTLSCAYIPFHQSQSRMMLSQWKEGKPYLSWSLVSDTEDSKAITSRTISLTAAAIILSNALCLSLTFPLSSNAIETSGIEKITVRQQIIRGTENILSSSKVLEAIRKIDQVDFDTDVQTDKAILLLPIVDMMNDFEKVPLLLKKGNLIGASELLADGRYDTVNFKKTFNKYSDNIFYKDPKRANLYLAGGATPTSLQTQQYLYRNSALTAINNVRDDIKLMLISAGTNQIDIESQDMIDAIDDCREASDAFTAYMDLADPADVKLASEAIRQSN